MPVKRTAEPDRDDRVQTDVGDPIELIYQEHARIWQCCEDLMRLGEDFAGDGSADMAASILDYIEHDLPLHRADEEEDLFPVLRLRAGAKDDIHAVLDRLVVEHRQDIEQGQALVAPLRRIAAGQAPEDAVMFANYVRAFRMLQHRHQAAENDAVIPLAFTILTDDDKAALAEKMAARRSPRPG